MKIAYDFFVSHCIVMYILIGIYHFSMRQRAIKFIGKYYPDAQDASFVKMNLYIEYYIQEVLNITRQYLKIRTLKDEESINLCEIIEEFIKYVVVAFENIYKDLISFDKAEMEISMDILLNELKEKLK